MVSFYSSDIVSCAMVSLRSQTLVLILGIPSPTVIVILVMATAVGSWSGPNWPKSKNAKVRVNTEESAVKPEPELKNTIGCNLNPSDGPGKPNSIIMKTVKTKWALNQLQQPICVHLTKTVKTLKAQS
ncbi:hypothetical protein Tco_1223649 [Tanacetum coccineum]